MRPRSSARAIRSASVLAAAACLAAVACGGSADVEHLVPRVHAVHAHDPAMFTEGLQVADGVLYESGGGYGTSELRASDRVSGRLIARRAYGRSVFAEGIGVDGDRLVQLTWRSGTAYVMDRGGLAPLGAYSYSGEGWGLCRSSRGWIMSDGSDLLTVRDPATFTVVATLPVRRDGRPVDRLNELECVGDTVYANVWQTEEIVRIAPSGRVSGVIDASSLPVRRPADPEAVLNGIAWIPGTDRFLLTGKLWPAMFEVSFATDG